jgi:hypothetical protein
MRQTHQSSAGRGKFTIQSDSRSPERIEELPNGSTQNVLEAYERGFLQLFQQPGIVRERLRYVLASAANSTL